MLNKRRPAHQLTLADRCGALGHTLYDVQTAGLYLMPDVTEQFDRGLVYKYISAAIVLHCRQFSDAFEVPEAAAVECVARDAAYKQHQNGLVVNSRKYIYL